MSLHYAWQVRANLDNLSRGLVGVFPGKSPASHISTQLWACARHIPSFRVGITFKWGQQTSMQVSNAVYAWVFCTQISIYVKALLSQCQTASTLIVLPRSREVELSVGLFSSLISQSTLTHIILSHFEKRICATIPCKDITFEEYWLNY